MGIVKFGDVVERINIKVDQSNPQLNYMEHGRRIIIPIKYYVGGEHIEGSEFMVHKKALIQGSTIGYQFQFGFRKGDILFMTKNPHLRKASMVDFDGLCSIATFVIASKSNNLLQNYLLLEMQSDRFWQYCEDNKSGGVNYFINWGTLSNYEFDLPPIEKQKELADKLWAAYRLKEGYKRLLAAIDEMVKSQFIEMFGNPLSPIQKWPIVRLGDYCIVNPTRPKGISDEMEVSFIPMQDVYDDGACNKFINRRYAEVKKGFTYCADGDVIFAKITPCMENGKGAELQGLTNAMGMGSTEFHVLRPISGKSISTWLYHFTKLDIIRKDAAKNMTGTGGQKRVPASYFDNFKIGVPSIDEQMNFAALANQADKSKFELKQCIENIDKVIKSLING